MIKEDIIILNIHVPNTRAFNLIKETLLHLESHIDLNKVIVGNFIFLFLPWIGHPDKN